MASGRGKHARAVEALLHLAHDLEPQAYRVFGTNKPRQRIRKTAPGPRNKRRIETAASHAAPERQDQSQYTGTTCKDMGARQAASGIATAKRATDHQSRLLTGQARRHGGDSHTLCAKVDSRRAKMPANRSRVSQLGISARPNSPERARREPRGVLGGGKVHPLGGQGSSQTGANTVRCK